MVGIISKEAKDELELEIAMELFTKGQISEEEYIEDIKDILGKIPAEYEPENIKKLEKKCWL
ncbi:MAG: hypothetical protein ACE5KT_04085 [Methanosarcinales archaeon]